MEKRICKNCGMTPKQHMVGACMPGVDSLRTDEIAHQIAAAIDMQSPENYRVALALRADAIGSGDERDIEPQLVTREHFEVIRSEIADALLKESRLYT